MFEALEDVRAVRHLSIFAPTSAVVFEVYVPSCKIEFASGDKALLGMSIRGYSIQFDGGYGLMEE
jgi:hypothetical protein